MPRSSRCYLWYLLQRSEMVDLMTSLLNFCSTTIVVVARVPEQFEVTIWLCPWLLTPSWGVNQSYWYTLKLQYGYAHSYRHFRTHWSFMKQCDSLVVFVCNNCIDFFLFILYVPVCEKVESKGRTTYNEASSNFKVFSCTQGFGRTEFWEVELFVVIFIY